MCRVVALISLPVHRYSVVVHIFSGPFGPVDCILILEQNCTKPGLGSMRNYALDQYFSTDSIDASQKILVSNATCRFPKDSFADYLVTGSRVSCILSSNVI